MAVVSANQFNLGVDPVGSISRGMSLGDQFRAMQLKKKQEEFLEKGGLEHPMAAQQAGRLGLDFQAKVFRNLGIADARTGQIDKKKAAEAADFAFKVENMTPEQQNKAIIKRVERLDSEGRDSSQTKELLSLPPEQRKNALQAVQLASIPNEERIKFMSGQLDRNKIKSFAPQANDKGGLSIPQILPDGSVKFVEVPGSVAETAVEKGARQLEEKSELESVKTSETEKREIKKLTAKRKQGYVDAGVEAADNMANIKRSIDLLDSVATGGFDNASLRAKQIFGVESGDEAELSTNLGRSVLAQLKPIFGAAFTAQEGESLKRIEAGFGKSTEGNKRLLKQLLKITERAARRGLAAAEDLEDSFTADEIKRAMTVTDTPEVDGELTAEEQAELEALRAEFGGQ
jgi:hypothetical protein